MALASRREVVLLSLLCPWLEGDCLLQLQGSWRATLPALCSGKEGLKMAEEASSGAGPCYCFILLLLSSLLQ